MPTRRGEGVGGTGRARDRGVRLRPDISERCGPMNADRVGELPVGVADVERRLQIHVEDRRSGMTVRQRARAE